MKKHLGFIIFFAVIIFIFLGRLIFMKAAFLGSDYLVQHYPWSKIYAESIKGFNFPFWTRYFHSGFPLMAEGQIGGFYPLNITMFFVLPFKVAYNYSVVLHFVLAGVFTYIYSRKLGADQWGGALASLLFCFGSAYAGCFNNTATVRTLVWFPLVLLLIENFLESKRLVYIVACGLISGMQFLAGFLQMAVYSLVFYIIYLCYDFRLKQIKVKDRILSLFLFVIISSIIALPQVLLSRPLVQVSGRSSASLGFALWKSFPPPLFLSAFFPSWLSFFGHQLYIGVFSILFLIYAIMHLKGYLRIRPLILVGLVALFAALGKYNPLYIALLKITRFYSFRNPSKFLFFALFAGSVLSGFGYSKFFNQPVKKLIKSAAAIFTCILAISMSIFFITRIFLYSFKDRIILWLQDYVLKYVFGKPYHRYDLQTYMDKINGTYLLLLKGAELGNIYTIFSLIMIVVAIAAGIYLYIKPGRIRVLKLPVFCIIFLDLFVYSFYGTGFRGNIKPFEHLSPANSKVFEVLKSDKDIFRILPFGLVDKNMPYWLKPNANAIYGLDSIAVYTPLAGHSYKEALLPLEVVDDSLGLVSPSNESLVKKYQLLRLLNVKYIISSRELKYDFLEKLIYNNKIFLYKLKDYLPRAFFTYKIDGDIKLESAKYLKVTEYKSGFAKIKITANKDGFLVFSENYYPGWISYVDNARARILKIKDLVQAVPLSSGTHTVVFEYRPTILQNKR